MRTALIWLVPSILCLDLLTRATADEVQPPDFPVTVNIGVVFPRNDSTYNNDLHLLPVVFAIQNARALFWFGWTIRWDIQRVTGPDEVSGVSAWGQLSYTATKAPLPPDAIGNDWVVANASWSRTDYEWEPGPYRLSWSLRKNYCTTEPGRLIIQTAISQLEGAVDFDVVDDGSGQSWNLTEGCPVYQSSRLISGASFRNTGTCMFISDEQPDETPDLCHLRLDQTMADCVMSNLTGSEDRSACEAWAQRGIGEDDGGNDDEENGDEDGNTDEDSQPDGRQGNDGEDSGPRTDSNGEEEDVASVPAILFTTVATIVLLAAGFIWI